MDQEIINRLPCGIIVLSRNFSVKQVNEQFLMLSGHSKKELLRIELSKLPFYEISNAAKKRINFNQCIGNTSDQVMHKSAMLKNADGLLSLVFLTGKKINSSEFVICVTDISREINCSVSTGTELSIISKSPLNTIVGKDEKIKSLYKLIELASDSVANVMISGESGTGKELVAKAIHNLSPRNSKPFVAVNCSSLSETLLESELFGHIKGSFTGAYRDKIGKFEAASEGTIFLDEIGEISPMIQVKLLRVIQEKEFERVGDNKTIRINMRIIAATNKNLRDLVNKGLFREDLYYRLNVFPIHTVPLRELRNDIPLLCSHFIDKFNKLTGKKIRGITEDGYRILLDYCWPGNVRELENAIEHAFVVCNKSLIDVFDLPQDIRLVSLRQGLCKGLGETNQPTYFYPEKSENETDYLMLHSRAKISKEQLVALLETNRWNKKETAEQLNISRVALWKKMKKFGLI